MMCFNRLPVDIILEILTRLPTEWVIECKLVSRTWYNLISHNSSFRKMHFQFHHRNHPSDSVTVDYVEFSFLALTGSGKFHYFEYKDDNREKSTPIKRIRRLNLSPPWNMFTIEGVILGYVGSCNGLVCLAGKTKIFICNPITREYVRLPGIKRGSDIVYGYWTNGFGYVSSTNEYKVVIIISWASVEVYVYTLGSGNGWRNLGELIIGKLGNKWEQGVFANGVIYWKYGALGMIKTFDLAEEKFCENLSLPPLPQDSNWSDHRIGVLNGFLFFAISLVVEGAECFDIWLLKKKNDDHDKKEGEEHQSFGWSKGFRIDCSQVLAVTNDDAVLTYSKNYINIYDTKASTSKRLVDFKKRVCEVIPHKNTLVSLKELGEKDTEIMESIEFTGQKAIICQL